MADKEKGSEPQQLDREEIERIYRTIWPSVMRTAQRYGSPQDADDIAQEALSRILLRVQRDNDPVVSLQSYAVAVTRSVAVDAFRREHRRKQVPTLQDDLETESELALLASGPISSEDDFELREFLIKTIREMSSQDRAILTALLLGGETTSSLATRLNVTPQVLAQRRRRLLIQLRQRAEAEGLAP